MAQKMDDASFDAEPTLNDSKSLDAGMSLKKVAIEFQKELNSVLKLKPPISKEKLDQVVDEAIKAVRNYKHIVYYIETFIKTVSI